jgi:hypothetical protein
MSSHYQSNKRHGFAHDYPIEGPIASMFRSMVEEIYHLEKGIYDDYDKELNEFLNMQMYVAKMERNMEEQLRMDGEI